MEFVVFLLVVAVIFVLSGIKVIDQYERAVVLTLGKFTGIREPGLRIIVPIFQKMFKIDQRTNKDHLRQEQNTKGVDQE